MRHPVFLVALQCDALRFGVISVHRLVFWWHCSATPCISVSFQCDALYSGGIAVRRHAFRCHFSATSCILPSVNPRNSIGRSAKGTARMSSGASQPARVLQLPRPPGHTAMGDLWGTSARRVVCATRLRRARRAHQTTAPRTACASKESGRPRRFGRPAPGGAPASLVPGEPPLVIP